MEEYKAKISIDTKAATNSLNDLGNSIEGVSEELIPLTTQMGEMEDKLMLMAYAGDTSSAEFKKLSKEVAGMRKTVRETDAGIEALSMTTSGKLGGALQGVASGFEFATGAMAMMGADSAEVEKAMLKVQAAMAMANSISGIKESIPAFKSMGSTAVTAFKGIKGAIGATGIGLLVIAIGALYANFDKLGGLVDWAKEKFDGMGEGIKTMVKISMYPLIVVIEGVMYALEALGIIESEEEQARSAAAKKNYARAQKQMELEAEAAKARKQNFENEQKNFDRLISLAEAEGKSTIELQKQKIQNSINIQKEQLKEMELTLQAFEATKKMTGDFGSMWSDLIEEGKTTINQAKENIKDSETELKVLDINARKESAARAQEARDAERAAAQAEHDAKKEIYISEQELFREIDEEHEALKLAAQEEAQAKALLSAQEYTQSLMDLPEEVVDVQEETFGKLGELQFKWAEAMKNNRKEVNDGLVQGASDMFATLGNLAELFQGRSAKSQEKAFKVQKAAQIGQATIDTFKAATGAYSSMASIPVVGPILGGIAAAAAVAAGLINIKKIQATKFEGGTVPSGGGGGGDSMPSASSIMSPNFNIVGNNPVNQLAQLGAQPVQAYVVSGEVTTAQSLDRNRIKNATL
jgi:hypothetical protein